MKEIPLFKFNKVALVDDADFEWLMRDYNWYLANWETREGYPPRIYAVGRRKGTNGSVFGMHRVIMGMPKGKKVDHWNGNGLDNQRHNLRVCTHAQNIANSVRRKPGFKGVIRERQTCQRPWRASMPNHKGTGSAPVGWFATAEEAAKAYDDAARKRYGEFACVNFPRPGERSALTGEIVPELQSA